MGPALAGKLPSGSGGLMGGRSAGARTPYFLLDEEKLLRNLEILKEVSDRAGCKILLAQKAFSMFSVYPLIRKYLAGTAASGLYEARLGAEEFGGETHVFSPAYRRDEFEEILKYADHRSSTAGAGEKIRGAGKGGGKIHRPAAEPGMLYPGRSRHLRSLRSRLPAGDHLEELEESLLPMLDGFHMHTLCEQNSDALEATLRAAEEKFGKYFAGKRWLNWAGTPYHPGRLRPGTADPTDPPFKRHLRHGSVPGAGGGGGVKCRVSGNGSAEIVRNNGMEIAILDASAACHMPDVLEMPYRPPLKDAGEPGENRIPIGWEVHLSGRDVIGDYSFASPSGRAAPWSLRIWPSIPW